MLIPHVDFPVRPPKETGESLAGYIIRFQGINGHWVPRALHDALSNLYRGIPDKAATAFDTIQTVVGTAVALDRKWWLGRPLTKRRSGGQERAWPAFSFNPVRFCPDCLQEHGFHLALWELPLMRACPVHRHGLLTACTVCSSPLLWSEFFPRWSCRCGQSIAAMQAGPAEPGAALVAHAIAASTDLELPPSLQKRLLKPTSGKYCLTDVYDNLEWAGDLRSVLSGRDPVHPSAQKRRTARRAGTPSWEARLLIDSHAQLAQRLVRALNRLFRSSKYYLTAVPHDHALSQAKLLLRASNPGGLPEKVRRAVAQALAPYALTLPTPSIILFTPRISSQERMACLKTFLEWWTELAVRLNNLDPEFQRKSEDAGKFTAYQQELDIVLILNTLLDAAQRQTDPGDFRALLHWWRIPAELRELRNPNEILNCLGTYLASVDASQVCFIRDLTLKTRRDSQ